MIPVNTHLKAFESHLILLNSPVKTRISYLSILRKYLQYCNAQHIEDAFSDAAVKQYLLYRYSQKMEWKTINMDYSAIQPKGLLSTEGTVSIPTRYCNALAYTCHYFEFRNIKNGSICDAIALISGEKYEVILTNGGGLYRYNTRDIVSVTSMEPLPILQFVGRSGHVSDMVGEKVDALSVQILADNLLLEFKELEAVFLCPYRKGDDAGYELLVISEQNEVNKIIEQVANKFLNENPYYKQAVDLTQLNPLNIRIQKPKTLLQFNEAYARMLGIKDGDVKLPLLLQVNFIDSILPQHD